ncbi:chemotaxis protein CheX [Pleionea sediminis]|uniref:chemotaxis protein CheX n=1 Tax=Pleionea sediminis TaxID=2569479 RepID=UPI001184809E|nr:chemotaxis protein CheX [Pleionea sediminis]
MGQDELTSKVLIHEVDSDAESKLKAFFTENNLTGLKDSQMNVLDIFNRNTDLGAAFLCETQDSNGIGGLELGKKIHQIRPEIPVFIRMNNPDSNLPDGYEHYFAGSYHIDDEVHLKELVNKHLFNEHYPIPLIRGIQQISQDSFQTAIDNISVTVDPPYLVKDQIIYGELFSLIPLESNWCRGFMMLQTTEAEIKQIISAGKTGLITNVPTFRDVNHILSEVTNMIWGSLKSKFFIEDDSDGKEDYASKIHVPTLVNHQHRFISFGSNEPHLCFRYTVKDNTGEHPDFTIYQKIIFNLSWQPELFKESTQETDDMVSAGELEFF